MNKKAHQEAKQIIDKTVEYLKEAPWNNTDATMMHAIRRQERAYDPFGPGAHEAEEDIIRTRTNVYNAIQVAMQKLRLGDRITAWHNTPGRTKEQVIDVLREARRLLG